MTKDSAYPFIRQLRKMAARQSVKERTDLELLQQFATERDESAFTALVERHGSLVWGVCQRILRDRHDAEDAFQATFLVLARQAGSVCKKESAGSWLYGVAYRTALSQRRAAQRRRQREKRVQTREVEQPAAAASLRELQAMLDEEVARLPAKLQAPFVLCCLQGKSYAQAALELGCKEGTVSSRLAQARKLLQDRLTRRGVTLSAVLTAATVSSTAEVAPAALVEMTAKSVVLSLGGTASTGLSAQAVILAKGATKTLSVAMRKLGAILLLAAVPIAGVGFWWQTEPRRQEVEAGPQQPQPNTALPAVEAKQPKPADNKADFADVEMHVIGVYGVANQFTAGAKTIEVEVLPTAKPVLLVLTSYYSVDWHVKLAKGARIKKAIVTGYNVQEIKGLPADVPVANRSYFPEDGSRRKEGYFYAYRWNTPRWREMVRRLNKETGLPLASFQGEYLGGSFIVDGKRGREQGQNGTIPRPCRNRELTSKELLAASADAELHVVGMYSQGHNNAGKPVDVEVRPTAKPIVLVLTSYMEEVWRLKLAQGARIKSVLAAGWFPQEVDGVPDDVPINYFCPDSSTYYFGDSRNPRGDRESFFAYHWNTYEYRRMVERLNDLTGLLVSTAQMGYTGHAFVVDGRRGRNFTQKERKPRPKLPKEPTPQELLAACDGAELHIVAASPVPGNKNGDEVEVEVRPTEKPIALALAASMNVLWNIKIAPGARVKAIVIGGREPEFEGIPANIPIINREINGFYEWNTIEYRRMVEKLNDLTGLLVSTFQREDERASFVVDGERGRKYAQRERKARPKLPKEPTPQELLAASAGAELHMVSLYRSDPESKNGDVVDVEVRPADKPIVLALTSYMSVLWNVKMVPGARVKAVIIGGYFEQEFDGIPAGIPIVYRAYWPSKKETYRDFFGHVWNSTLKDSVNSLYNGQRVAKRLKDLTGLSVATFQGKENGVAFVVDGKRGRDFAKAEPEAEEDPLADVADIPSQEIRAGGDADKRYFLIGPKKDAKAPDAGYGLLVILPGGDGSADFHPFVKRIYKNALSDRYLAVQPIAIKWTADQEIVWPTKKLPVAKMKFSTEEFIDAVIEDAAKKHKIDRDRVFSLSWSSSGPAAYAASLRGKPSVKGSFIAMSVFKPQLLPPLRVAKGRAYYLYHSPDDRICPNRMAEQAKRSLTENGAKVRLQTYEGGHGWRGDVYEDIRQGIDWLEKEQEKAGK